jgi:hypothetical protein
MNRSWSPEGREVKKILYTFNKSSGDYFPNALYSHECTFHLDKERH